MATDERSPGRASAGTTPRPVRVGEGDRPLRLDLFLARSIPGCSRQAAKRALDAGEVRVNGRRGTKGQTVSAGDVVEVAEHLFNPRGLVGNASLGLTVLYEDDLVVAVDKPPGMASLALRAAETGTVANFLVARYPETARVGGRLESGLLHRLDTGTSGVLLAARTPAAHAALREQFQTHRVAKDYLAVVDGDVRPAGSISTRIAHHRNPKKMRIDEAENGGNGRPASTVYRPIVAGPERTHTLLRVQIRTGVRHQIRVHLASIGHPITGDSLYGAAAAATAPARQLLHAVSVEFDHPRSGSAQRIVCPPPADFTAFVAAWGHRAQRALAMQARR